MIIKQIETTIAALVLALAVAIAGFAVWTISSKIHNSKLAEIEKKHAEQIGQYERNIGAIKAKAQEETAAAMARKVLPVPAGPIPRVTSCFLMASR